MNSKFRCRGCREYYPAETKIKVQIGSFHSFDCAAEYGRRQAQKRAQKERDERHRELKKKVRDNDKSHWRKKAQQVFNKYIRLRDKEKGCISCDAPLVGKFDAGHYRSVGAHPELRYCEINNWGQCVQCNQHFSGNLINYRIGLSKRISADELEWLEGHHEPKRYTVEDLKAIVEEYKGKIKELQDAN